MCTGIVVSTTETRGKEVLRAIARYKEDQEGVEVERHKTALRRLPSGEEEYIETVLIPIPAGPGHITFILGPEGDSQAELGTVMRTCPRGEEIKLPNTGSPSEDLKKILAAIEATAVV